MKENLQEQNMRKIWDVRKIDREFVEEKNEREWLSERERECVCVIENRVDFRSIKLIFRSRINMFVLEAFIVILLANIINNIYISIVILKS